MTVQFFDIPVTADDGHGWNLAAAVPAQPKAALLWLPAMGVAAKHYRPLAEALAAHGIAVFLHEMRGNGSSNLRPALPDNLPRTTVTDGLTRINGLFRHGWLIAPALVEQALAASGMAAAT